jgi:transposase
MAVFNLDKHAFVGNAGTLPVPKTDEVTRRLAMLLEGECELGPKAAAEKFAFSRARYFQLRRQFQQSGADGLLPQKRGPKRNYRRTDEIVRQVIRHRFLDPEASAEVIAQKLIQTGATISIRSVQRIIHDYAIQKKTLPASFAPAADRNATHHAAHPTAARRRGQP